VAGTRLTFHVPPEAEPGKLIPLLEAIYRDGVEFSTVKALLDFAWAQGLGTRVEMWVLATACGILDSGQSDHIALTQVGRAVAQLKPETRADVIHYLLYTGWQQENPAVNSFLWTYRVVVDTLWMRPSTNVSADPQAIVEELRNRSQEAFLGVPGYDSGSVSLSPKSIRGVRKWLEALTPPVIDNDVFSRRRFCPAELALLAAAWVARRVAAEVDIDFLLTPDRREAICRLCLIDPSALDNVLDWMLPVYPEVILPGTGAGVYGRALHFLRWPEMEDVLR
jgi:hypothetical protein